MESVKDPLLQLLSSHLQETFDTMKQCILDLVERSLQGLEPQGGSLEPLRTPSDADEPVAPHSTQELDLVLRPSDNEEQNKSVVKIKEEPGSDCLQETNMVLQEDALKPEPEGPGPTTDSTSQRAERRFLWNVYGKLFQRKWKLTRHQLVHTGERPYPCDICLKSFTKSGVLKRHKLIHTGERPYSCDVCAKSFNQSGVLKRHKLIHTGERPYPCGVCEKSFRRRDEVNRHQRNHHKIHFSGTEPGEGVPTESGET